MAPKKAVAPKPKKATKPKKDDDDELLAAMMSQNAEASKKLAEEKKAADKKAAEKARHQEAEEKKRLKALSALPPVYVNDVAEMVFEKLGGEKQLFRDMCFCSYAMNNFFSYVIETKRTLMIRTTAHPEGEKVESFVVHDLDREEGSPHSWNIIKAASGTYCIDLTIKQFLPKGRYGYKKDNNEALGPVPVMAPSRLVKDTKDEKDGVAHEGVVATDGGILPEGPIECAKPMPAGTAKHYLKFLSSARSGRFSGMSAAEDKTARILNKDKTRTTELIELHEAMVEAFFQLPEEKKN